MISSFFEVSIDHLDQMCIEWSVWLDDLFIWDDASLLR